MSIHVMTLAYGDVPYATFSIDINSAYCKRHGYAFTVIRPDEPPLSDRDPVWYKVKGVRDGLAGHSHILFLDADAYFFDFERRIEQLIDETMRPDDLVVVGNDAQDREVCWSRDSANTGTFLVRSGAEATALFQEWWDLPLHRPDWGVTWPFEQGGFQRHIFHKYRDRIHLVPYHHLNGRDGMFIRHLVHMPNGQRRTILESEHGRLLTPAQFVAQPGGVP